MGDQERLSRRQVLAAGVGVTGSHLFARLATDGDGRTSSDIDGWIINLDTEDVEDETGVIEVIREPSMTPCTGGELYVGQLCTGAEFRLLVGWGTPQPSVGESYRFSATGDRDLCGDIKVQLEGTEPCSEASPEMFDDLPTTTETETETTTTTTETETTTTKTPTTTTETETTTTETPTTTTETETTTTTETPTTTTETSTTTTETPTTTTETETTTTTTRTDEEASSPTTDVVSRLRNRLLGRRD